MADALTQAEREAAVEVFGEDVVRMSEEAMPAWASEPWWDGWKKRKVHNAVERHCSDTSMWISCLGQLLCSLRASSPGSSGPT